jgi:hypothetical protein
MQVEVLTEHQLDRLHEASLHIPKIWEWCLHPEVRRRSVAGAWGRDAEPRMMPESLVIDSLARAGKRFTIYGRTMRRRPSSAQAGELQLSSGQALWLDDTTGERRYASSATRTAHGWRMRCLT